LSGSQIGGFSYFPENVKLCESPGKAGGLPNGNYGRNRIDLRSTVQDKA
jgi:hypothetical protein